MITVGDLFLCLNYLVKKDVKVTATVRLKSTSSRLSGI